MAARILPVNFFDQVTDLAVTPAAVSTMPVTNLQSNVRDRVWRSPNRDPQVFTGSYGGNSRQASAWGIFPGRGAASLLGVQARLELFSDAAYVTRVYDSGVLDVFTWSGMGWGDFAWGAHPWGVEVSDRAARLAPLLKFFTATAHGSWRITVTDSGAMDTTYFEASRFWIADYVEAPYNMVHGAAPAWRSNSQHQRSIGGSLRRLSRTQWRELRGEFVFATEADRAAWFALCYAADPGNEIVLSLFQDGTRRDRDFAVMGSLEVLNPVIWENENFHKLQLAIVES